MDKNEILQMLQDEDIKVALSAALFPTGKDGKKGFSFGKHEKEPEGEMVKLQEELQRLHEETKAKTMETKGMSGKLQELLGGNNKLLSDNETLRDTLEKTQEENVLLQKSLDNYTQVLSKTQDSLEKQKYDNQELFKINQKQAQRIHYFEEELQIFFLYQGLSAVGKDVFSSVFKGTNRFDEFTVRAMGRPDIEKLYDLISHQLMSGYYDDIEELHQIYLYFIDLYNRKFSDVAYTLDFVAIGQDYNPSKHIKSLDSAQSGKIEHIYLKGYLFESSKQTFEKKSIVKVSN